MLKQYLVILTAILVLGFAFFFINERGADYLEKNTSNTSTVPVENTTATTQEFTSSDGRISLRFPASWYVVDTTPAGGAGQFGPIVQTWTIANFPATEGASGNGENTVTIDFTIEEGGGNLPLESLVSCDGKTITCERIGIDNELFAQSKAVLNTGTQLTTIATFYDQKILKATASIQAGDRQAANAIEAEKVLQSIRFQNTPVTN